MRLSKIKTNKLHLAYEESGPKGGERLLLLHGWPDSPRTWDKVLPILHGAGYRTISPYLRGYGKSTFNSPFLGRKLPRTGEPEAFAQDMIDLVNALGMKRFHFIGHDWGARTGLVLAALFPDRLKSLVTLSVPFQPGKAEPPRFPQDRAFWYQWLLCTNPGEKKFRADPVAFCREQWDTWSPSGWYTEAELKQTAESWTGKDFPDVVLHSYRTRWEHALRDKAYSSLHKRFESTTTISVPTLLIHGAVDHCELLETTEGAEAHFTGTYRREVLAGVGHFPQREAPDEVALNILRHVRG